MTFPIEQLTPEQFPPLLKEIPDPPKTLYLRGAPIKHGVPHLTVVGARAYTSYGKQMCERIISDLAGSDVVVVSGMALGIDGIAHRAAIRAGVHTVAVPGSGLSDDVLYPASHQSLARNILEAGGTLMSEFVPSWKPRPESFPQRNRIMAGISTAILVIEAERRSGTLITARLATEYNRDVYAVPGPVGSATSAGPHLLIQKGAALVESGKDVLEALGVATQPLQQVLFLSPDEERVRKALTQPCSRDDLARTLGMPIGAFNALMSSLELKGYIRERLGMLEWCV